MSFEILLDGTLRDLYKKKDAMLVDLAVMPIQTGSRLRRTGLQKSISDLNWEILILEKKQDYGDDFEGLFNFLVREIPAERIYSDARYGLRVLSKGSPEMCYLILPCDYKEGRFLISPTGRDEKIVSVRRDIANPFQTLKEVDKFFRSTN